MVAQSIAAGLESSSRNFDLDIVKISLTMGNICPGIFRTILPILFLVENSPGGSFSNPGALEVDSECGCVQLGTPRIIAWSR